MTDQITVLRAHSSLYMAKRFDGQAWSDYSTAKHFRPATEPVADLPALAALLDQMLGDKHGCVIRGRIREGVDRDTHAHLFNKQGHIVRKLLAFEDVPHHWIMLDVDNFEPEADPVQDPEAAILEYIESELPPEFQEVDFYWQLSNRAGFSRALKAHLWFWLETPYDSDTLREWAGSLQLNVDRSLFNPVQVHYTAAPVFIDSARDPVPRRSGYHEGMFGQGVPLEIDPDLVAEARREPGDGTYRVREDPTSKPGWVGAFCRAYTIDEVIDDFLPHVFERFDDDGHLNFLLGSGAARGAFITEDGKHIVNVHASDPLGRHASNAFDLVRHYLHDGEFDDETKDMHLRASYIAMCERCSDDAKVRACNISADEHAAALFGMVPELPDNLPDDDAPAEGITEEGTEDPSGHALRRLLVADVEEWQALLEVHHKTAKVLDTAFNVKLILCGDPALKGKIVRDTFHNDIRAISSLPWRPVTNSINGDIWDDEDDHQLIDYITRRYHIEPSQQRIVHAVMVVASLNKRHPVRRYLRSIEWDGKPRLDTWLRDYMSAPDDAYTRQAGAKTLIAAVARVMEPGCKFDHALIIEGAQGTGKSTAIATLGGAWFSDNLPTLKGKESVEALDGSWIVEMGELHALKASRQDAEAVKAYISRQTDKMRKAYARHVREYPRQNVFIGTTNDSEYLIDATGNRRFWPVETGKVDTVGIRRDRDQLWAEAFARYQQGETRFLEGEAVELASVAQDDRYQEDDIFGLVQDYLEGRRSNAEGFDAVEGGEAEPLDKACVIEIYRAVYSGSGTAPSRDERKAIRRVMKRMPGWSPKVRSQATHVPGVGTQRVYYRIGSIEDPLHPSF